MVTASSVYTDNFTFVSRLIEWEYVFQKFKDGLWKIDTEETEKEQPTDVRTGTVGWKFLLIHRMIVYLICLDSDHQ